MSNTWNHTRIAEWLSNNSINNYKIYDDLSVDMSDEEMVFSVLNYTHLPFPIRLADGDFYNDSRGLESLKNSPQRVEGVFVAKNTLIEDLVGGPQYVRDDYKVSGCKFLVDFTGIAKFIGGDFIASGCTNTICITTGFIPILLSEIHGRIQIDRRDVWGIVTSDRVNGKIPRELIPAKINEIRELPKYELGK
jgi:hypothetical protein